MKEQLEIYDCRRAESHDSREWMYILICVTKTAINAFQLNNPVILRLKFGQGGFHLLANGRKRSAKHLECLTGITQPSSKVGENVRSPYSASSLFINCPSSPCRPPLHPQHTWESVTSITARPSQVL